MSIELQPRGCRAKGTAATNRNLAHVLINGVRCQLGDRRAGLATQSNTTCQLAEHPVLDGVRAVKITNVTTVGVEVSRGELIAEQANHTLGEIEERADAGVRLPVIVAEETFIVPPQFGEAIIGANQEALAEVLVQLDFQGLVAAHRFRIAVWFSVGDGKASNIWILTAGSAYNVAKAVFLHPVIGYAIRRRRTVWIVLLLDLVGEVIRARAGIANYVHLIWQTKVRTFRRDALHVFDDAFQSTIRVADGEHHTASHFTLKAKQILLFEVQPGAGVNQFGNGGGCSDIAEAIGSAQQVCRVVDRSDCSVGVG